MPHSRTASLLLALVILLTNWVALQAEDIETRYGEIYLQRESGPLKADLYMPSGKGPFPAVLVVHGGAWCMGSRAQLSGFAQAAARHGMVAVAISYRLAPQHKFPAQIEDCKAAVRWIRSQAVELKIDPQRIGAFGYSAGAHLATLLGATDSNDGLDGVADPDRHLSARVQVVTGGGLPCDFRVLELDSQDLAFWLGGTRREVAEVYRQASPRAFASDDDPPMFFFHGQNDDLVPLSSPRAMCESLQAVGVTADLYIVPKIGHTFAAFDRTARQKTLAFLVQHLAADVE
ncbi:MAG: alpha/beta hydrolase [Pirellulales bacterium]|nr:alpha/beta hydrolase [Pirellulales bacterium]